MLSFGNGYRPGFILLYRDPDSGGAGLGHGRRIGLGDRSSVIIYKGGNLKVSGYLDMSMAWFLKISRSPHVLGGWEVLEVSWEDILHV